MLHRRLSMGMQSLEMQEKCEAFCKLVCDTTYKSDTYKSDTYKSDRRRLVITKSSKCSEIQSPLAVVHAPTQDKQ